MLRVAPSILSADFGKLNQDIKSVESFCDMLHVDIMDGHFVPNLSLGVPVVESIRSKKPLDVHLMIEHPEKYFESFSRAVKRAVGVKIAKKSYLVFHVEATSHVFKMIDIIHGLGMLAGIAFNPDTPLAKVPVKAFHAADMVLLMTVFPGFGGQPFIASVLPKIRELRDMCPEIDIQVDGGINPETARHAVFAGANVLVAGSFVFDAKDRKKALASLKADC